MNTSIKTDTKPNQGAGYLIGGAATIVMAIIVFAISEHITIAISASVPVGVTVGILLEQKLQGKKEQSRKMRYYLTGLIISGTALFIFILFFK